MVLLAANFHRATPEWDGDGGCRSVPRVKQVQMGRVVSVRAEEVDAAMVKVEPPAAGTYDPPRSVSAFPLFRHPAPRYIRATPTRVPCPTNSALRTRPSCAMWSACPGFRPSTPLLGDNPYILHNQSSLTTQCCLHTVSALPPATNVNSHQRIFE